MVDIPPFLQGRQVFLILHMLSSPPSLFEKMSTIKGQNCLPGELILAIKFTYQLTKKGH